MKFTHITSIGPVETPTFTMLWHKKTPSSCVEKISRDDVPGGSCNANPSLTPPVIGHFCKRRAVPHLDHFAASSYSSRNRSPKLD